MNELTPEMVFGTSDAGRKAAAAYEHWKRATLRVVTARAMADVVIAAAGRTQSAAMATMERTPEMDLVASVALELGEAMADRDLAQRALDRAIANADFDQIVGNVEFADRARREENLR